VGRFDRERPSSGRKAVEARKEFSVAEDRERFKPDAEAARQDEGDDVEAHRLKPEAEAEELAATEEPPDVEGHRLTPKHKP
jgi:hypothetical protein